MIIIAINMPTKYEDPSRPNLSFDSQSKSSFYTQLSRYSGSVVFGLIIEALKLFFPIGLCSQMSCFEHFFQIPFCGG